MAGNKKDLEQNLKAVETYVPHDLWRHFAQIASIPRPSGHEDQVLTYIVEQAKASGCTTSRDRVGNLLVIKPGSERDLTPLGFQGHVDMVCEKNAGHPHVFSRDPIRLTPRSSHPGWLYADGTTLGADNGIGVATMLALMGQPQTRRRDLEFLFTIDEETGLTGAQGLAEGWLRSQTLLNLDTEEEGALYVGCSGGSDLDAYWKIQRVSKTARNGFYGLLAVKNLRGGHSGIDIDKQRANALKVLTHSLHQLVTTHSQDISVISVQGGQARNAIPREAWALLWIESRESLENVKQSLTSQVQDLTSRWQGIYAEADGEITLRFDLFGSPHALEQEIGPELAERTKWQPWDQDFLTQWLYAVMALPSQPYRFQLDIPGLVRTSTNWGVLETDETTVMIRNKLRGSYDPELEILKKEITGLLSLAGAEVKSGGSYCGWQPDLQSPLLAKAQKVHEKVFGKRAHVKAVHAGLECGLIGSKYPKMQMISFGPDIQNAHSPDECVQVDSVSHFWDYVVELVAELDRELP
jgi:dipeptidase D